jgi:hypothetical protein
MVIDALVVLRDICGYSSEEAIHISRWTARAILRVGLDEGMDGETADAG